MFLGRGAARELDRVIESYGDACPVWSDAVRVVGCSASARITVVRVPAMRDAMNGSGEVERSGPVRDDLTPSARAACPHLCFEFRAVIVTLLVPVLALLVSLREHHPLVSHLSLAQRGRPDAIHQPQ
jgi:hypothetical protein